MRYGYRCSEHGEFDLNRPMSEASLPGLCRKCFKPAPRYYGFQTMNIHIPARMKAKHTTHFDYLPKPSDYDSRAEYLKDTENLEPYRGTPSGKRPLTQDKERMKKARSSNEKQSLKDPAVTARLAEHREACLAER